MRESALEPLHLVETRHGQLRPWIWMTEEDLGWTERLSTSWRLSASAQRGTVRRGRERGRRPWRQPPESK